jgi:hypothetical protein
MPRLRLGIVGGLAAGAIIGSARRPLLDQWGNVIGYSQPRFFCP